MLDTIGPEQFTEWLAADRLGLTPDTWQQAGTIASAIHNELAQIRAIVTQKAMTINDIHVPDTYIPGRRRKKKRGGSIEKHRAKVSRQHASKKNR